jgi:hypothetical protein
MEVKGAHLGQVGFRETATVAGGQVVGQALPEPFPVGGAALPGLSGT